MKRKFVKLSTAFLTTTVMLSLSNINVVQGKKTSNESKTVNVKHEKHVKKDRFHNKDIKNHKGNSRSHLNSQPISQLSAKGVGGFGYQTTGGSSTDGNVFNVTSTEQLRKALKSNSNASRIIIIKASLDGNDGLTEDDYASGTGYDLNKYLSTYDPSTYGKNEPAGAQETARSKAEQNQKKHVVFDVPSNTSIIGSKGITLSNINFMVHGNNVIFSNLSMTAPVDDFPQWDPKDGTAGNWNSQYDAISLKGATNVWIDHSKFDDGSTNDSRAAKYYGRQYQQHDGLVDISDASDNVTISNNMFANHDKTMLIGSSDNATSDHGKLHVSILDNYFLNNTQRTPRVRYGTVEVINNYFKNQNRPPYQLGYVVGAGNQATILVSHNVADLAKHADHFIQKESKGKSSVTQNNNLINGHLDNDNEGKTLSKTNVNVMPTNQVKSSVLANVGPK